MMSTPMTGVVPVIAMPGSIECKRLHNHREKNSMMEISRPLSSDIEEMMVVVL